MSTARPNEAYYRLCTGSWAAPLDVQLTDLRVLFGALSLFDALGFLALRCIPRSLRRLETQVWFDGNLVIHTTRARCLGVPVLSGREEIELSSDGLGLRLEGTQSSAPFWWRKRKVQASGQVDPSGTKAHYEISWYGSPMVQETTASADTVRLDQRSSWFTGSQQLVRTPTRA